MKYYISVSVTTEDVDGVQAAYRWLSDQLEEIAKNYPKAQISINKYSVEEKVA